jgi:hypothetical protein
LLENTSGLALFLLLPLDLARQHVVMLLLIVKIYITYSQRSTITEFQG